MRWIKCKNCGKILQVDGEKTLCPECREAIRRKSTLADRTCRQCGKTFLGGPRAWYCPECRVMRQKEACKRYYRQGPKRPLGSIDQCVICGKDFVVKNARQKYCPDCAAEAVKAVDREQGREWNAEHRETLAAQKKENAKNRKVCSVCGTPFYTGGPEATCSLECAAALNSYNAAKADHKRGKRASPPSLVEIAVRRGIDVRNLYAPIKNVRVKNLIGQKFGELTVIGFSGKSTHGGGAVWECLCSCGKICEKTSNALQEGHVRSCGHLKHCRGSRGKRGKQSRLDGIQPGDVFGELTAIRPTDERKRGAVVWECRCSCGKTCYIPAGALSYGQVRSCGHLRKRKRLIIMWETARENELPVDDVLAVSLRGKYLVGKIVAQSESKTGYACQSRTETLMDISRWAKLPK